MTGPTGPIVVAAGVIIAQTGRVILAKRNQPLFPDLHEKWECPGGKVQFNESLQTTIIRELREELNIHVEVTRQLNLIQENVYRYGNGDPRLHAIVIPFECRYQRGLPTARVPQVMAVKSFDKDDLPSPEDCLPGTHEFIQEAFARGGYRW